MYWRNANWCLQRYAYERFCLKHFRYRNHAVELATIEHQTLQQIISNVCGAAPHCFDFQMLALRLFPIWLFSLVLRMHNRRHRGVRGMFHREQRLLVPALVMSGIPCDLSFLLWGFFLPQRKGRSYPLESDFRMVKHERWCSTNRRIVL